ncbi:large-conductance mechanosensitive channel protein MscL [Neobacillus vireti]|uniref:Large-conductance mechanosensitive channel n=1 Tax=Neobacillus vireti LMG 21834 TaxID=1131730 RepID=A0AB94IU93_9BACI|nr:large-conductance mechanosensitive channel protein MscL [Neobacillus vireti]ETI70632.1 large-conductance mechanosensitive channel [Neobacillus vireti LMG 21834]KLT15294.1 mechanosensitive ion channel protein MscL [Neobacillus vireti]
MWNDFKQFAMKGNVIDLAVGVVIGGAFGKIVSSLVADVIMPLVGMIIGVVDFSDLAYGKLKYGQFIQTVVDFLIISFSIFLFVKFLYRFRKKEELDEVPEKVDRSEELLAEIRDLLKEDRDISRKNETS